MSRQNVICLSSDEEEEDDVQVLAFHHATQQLIQQAPPKVVKKLCEAECPICFDSVKDATMTFCGHVYCLECLQKSISASSARGQTKGKKGVGLCPMCRKSVAFKDTIVLRLKKGKKVVPPDTSPKESINGKDSDNIHHFGSEKTSSLSKDSPHGSDHDLSQTDDELIGLF